MNPPFTLLQAFSLHAYNSFGIAAKTRYFVAIKTLEQLQQLQTAIQATPALAALPRIVLGGGSNVILSDVIEGLVVQVSLKGIEIVSESETEAVVSAAAGENWHDFVLWTLAQGLGGLENLSLIPGAVGAAPIQNIGAYGIEMQEHFLSLRAFDFETGEIVVFTREQCQFAYRDSIFKNAAKDRYFILEVSFALPKQWQPRLAYGDLAKLLQERGIHTPSPSDVSEAVIAIRQSKLPDPKLIGNAGSFFKNPIVNAETRARIVQAYPQCVNYPQQQGDFKLAAGWLIEQCGWKGRRCGTVGVYEKQALVLVNLGGATGTDVRRVAQKIQADVADKFGVLLEVEPVFV